MPHLKKISKIKRSSRLTMFFIACLIIFTAVWIFINKLDFSSSATSLEFGVTFSHAYAAESLKMDWTEVYWHIINDLQVKKIRLISYWDKIEEGNNEYNFNDLDWMISEAAKKNIEIVLALGRRAPRWPECHDPIWLKDLTEDAKQKELLEMVGKTIDRFKPYGNIIAWQIENEPFLKVFGECPEPDFEIVKKEIALARSLDDRPIITTDSGELSNWHKAAGLADVFGTTMYKTVWTNFLGAWRYPFPPAFYYWKSQSIMSRFHLDKVIVSELQAEPWFPAGKDITDIDLNTQFNSFSINDFADNLKFVRRAGFNECYLWGVEWWYWLAKEKNRPEFWNFAQSIWQDD